MSSDGPDFTLSMEHQPYAGLTIIQMIEQEHRFVESLFERYAKATDLLVKQDIANSCIKALTVHAVCEEQEFYPAIRYKFPDGREVADRCLREHSHLKDTLNRLDAMDPADPEYDEEFRRVVLETISHAVEHEEKKVLPRFKKFFNETELLELGERYVAAMQLAHHRHRAQRAAKETMQGSSSLESSKEAGPIGAEKKPVDLLKSMPGAATTGKEQTFNAAARNV